MGETRILAPPHDVGASVGPDGLPWRIPHQSEKGQVVGGQSQHTGVGAGTGFNHPLSHDRPDIPVDENGLPMHIADLPSMTEEEVRNLDKDTYNTLFGTAQPSLVPAWIRIEKMLRQKKEVATSNPAGLGQIGYYRSAARIDPNELDTDDPLGPQCKYLKAEARRKHLKARRTQEGITAKVNRRQRLQRRANEIESELGQWLFDFARKQRWIK